MLLSSGLLTEVAVARQVDWKRDLEFLVAEIKQRHPDPFTVISESDFDANVARLLKRIESLDANDATFELMELVAQIGDGHTSVVPDFKSFRFFPINVKWFKDGVYVRAVDRSHKELIGAKLVAVGDHPIEKVIEQFSRFMPHDNIWAVRQRIDKQFQTVEFLDRAGALDDKDTATFHFEKGKIKLTAKMRAVAAHDAGRIRFINPYAAGMMEDSVFLKLLIKDERGLPFWNEWIPAEKTIYFKYNQCRDPAGFRELVEGTAAFISENKVDKFVLDLRDNSGGSSLVFEPLLKYLLNSDLNQKGKLFVIVGRGTFSSGVFAACEMRKTNAIFVGEPTSGKPNHFGEVKTFQLPSSGLKVQHSTKSFKLLDDDSNTFEPDLKIEYTAADTFAARDQALQAVFDYQAESK
ncbi:S41 family peptidase [Mariniblastus fucicola]|nr:hypothetical protein [Mariniblastus fucicola]